MSSMPPVIISGLVCWPISTMVDFNLRFILTYIIAIFVFILSSYFISLSKWEKDFFNRLLVKYLKK